MCQMKIPFSYQLTLIIEPNWIEIIKKFIPELSDKKPGEIYK